MVLLQAGRTVAHACYNLRLRRQWSLSRQPEDSDVSSRTLAPYSDKSTVSCLIKARIVGSRVRQSDLVTQANGSQKNCKSVSTSPFGRARCTNDGPQVCVSLTAEKMQSHLVRRQGTKPRN